jgi:DNA-binding NtrC family response regulator
MLKKAGYVVETAATGTEALLKFHSFIPELVLLDLNLPDAFGLDLLEKMKDFDDNLAVMIISASSQADLAVNAFKLGADQFFGKPFNLDSIKSAVSECLLEKESRKEECASLLKMRNSTGHDQLIGNSPKMVETSRLIHLSASSDAKTILITGESGTGKELVARAVHQYSARATKPFIEINCAAIPENLIENELFGHEKGAYTDAAKQQKGVFELASGGTVFLDEIGDMPLMMQTKLLKVLESRSFRRLGGEEAVETDIRIIAATNQDLPRLVADGKFRGDLYYRLNMMNICIPPLRERLEDIPALIQYFIRQLNNEYGRNVERVSNEALEFLMSYSWPGNVRELRNAIERAMMLAKGNVLRDFYINRESQQVRLDFEAKQDLGMLTDKNYRLFAGFQLPPSGISLEDVEKQLIALALEESNGNQSRAAKALKMSRDTLRYRMKKFGFTESAEQKPIEDLPAEATHPNPSSAHAQAVPGGFKWHTC